MPDYIIGSPEFIKNIDGWLFENDQKFAKYISKNKSKIPPMFTAYDKTLYRGMTIDEDFLMAVAEGNMVFKSLTSWSKDKNVAKKFVNDPAYRISKTAGIKILVHKKIKQVVFDIHNFILFMGDGQLELLGLDALSMDSALKEQEVLVDVGVKILKKDLDVIK